MIGSFSVGLGMWLVPFVSVCLLSLQQLLVAISLQYFYAFLISRLTICVVLVFPPMVALGCVFPALLSTARSNSSRLDIGQGQSVKAVGFCLQQALLVRSRVVCLPVLFCFHSLLLQFLALVVKAVSRVRFRAQQLFFSLLACYAFLTTCRLRGSFQEKLFQWGPFVASCVVTTMFVCSRPGWDLQLLSSARAS